MAVNYNWTFGPLEAYPTASGEIDVVFIVHWQYHASETVDTTTYTSTSIGTIGIPLTTGSAFIPYPDLTFNDVEGWVTTAMGPEQVASLEAGLAQNIANQINPPVIYLPNPWETTTTTTTTSTTTTTTTVEEPTEE
jgi:hypothetical protein